MKKIIKTIIPFAVLAMSLTGCLSGGGVDKTKTNISVYSFNGGVGNVWLTNAIKEFEELHSADSYEDGKTGVKIAWTGNTDSQGALSTMKTSSNAIYFTEKGDAPYTLASKELVYDISDLLKQKADESETKTIEEKIDEDYRSVLKGEDGNYYALPHYEWYPGLTYDISAFDRLLCYFAAPDETDVFNYEAAITEGGKNYNFGAANFIGSANAKKSCGNDGLYGTEDDGLPSSVQEFLILCSRLKANGLAPLACVGNHRDYSAYLLQGFLTSLLGREGIQNFYDFDGTANILDIDSNGNIIMDGTNELFCTGSGIPAPRFTSKTVNEATGYLMRETYERYYLAGLMKIFIDCNFFTDKSINSGVDNKQTQRGFIDRVDKYTSAMLIEGNYWFNEANAEGYFEAYKKKNREDRNIGWMSLPSLLTGSVNVDTTGEGYKTPLLDTGYSYCVVNKNAMDRGSEGYRKAVLDFVKFLYSEQQLKNFTKTTGVGKAAIEYDFNSSEVTLSLSGFQKQVLALKENNGVVYTTAKSNTFRRHQGDFQFGIRAPIWQTTIGRTTYNDYISAFTDKDQKNSPESVVKGSFISKDTWENVYYKN